jgi:chloride channel 3/4/5
VSIVNIVHIEELTRRPRVILVSQEGSLVGLVTVKDVLRHEAFTHHNRSSQPKTPVGHRRRDSQGSWNGWEENWQEQEDVGGVRGNGLEYALEAGLSWVKIRTAGMVGMLGRGRNGRRREPGGVDAAYDYELSDDRPT